MSLLAEIHDVPNLRTNLMFEVEVLCKHLDIKLGELRRSDLLKDKRMPVNSNDLSGRPTNSDLGRPVNGDLRPVKKGKK